MQQLKQQHLANLNWNVQMAKIMEYTLQYFIIIIMVYFAVNSVVMGNDGG